MIPIYRNVPSLRAQTAEWRRLGRKIALVPTMGALHDGHLTLVYAARDKADHVIVSIFVNPTQFGPREDFAAYPRDEAADLAKLVSAGTDGLYAPPVAVVYPPGFATEISVRGLTDGLCGPFRPGHFTGVATVVAKLLLQTAADIALFGEKDYQQLQVIRRLARDLDIETEIEGIATVREADGLALSSRNAYLSAEERLIAPTLFRVMNDIAAKLRDGGPAAPLLQAGIAEIRTAGFGAVDYLELCDADDLRPLDHWRPPARLLVAARLGKTRLIDNIALG